MTILLPSRSPEQWKELLADPEKHWRSGFSARTLAYSWQGAAGFPPEISAVLRQQFPSIELLLAIPEHKVSLPGGGRASQNDLWVLARNGDELVSIAVEGKVSEPFGPTLNEWLAGASPGKLERIAYLRSTLRCRDDVSGTLRYQLFHRAASAILEAKRFTARHAVFLVHSFSPSREWFDDFRAFAQILGVDAEANTLTKVSNCNGVDFSMAWICGDPHYLNC